MSNFGTGNQTTETDIISILLSLKSNIMKDTHCVEVGIVTNIDNTIFCKSLNNESIVECYKLNNLNISENDIVVIIFADYDFRENLQRVKNGLNAQNIENKTPHTKNAGIIIGKL